jgi:CHAT domain
MASVNVFPPPAEVVQALDRLSNDRVADALPLLEHSAAFLLQEQLERRMFHLEDLRDIGLGTLFDRYTERADQLQGLGSTFASPRPEVIGELNQLTGAVRSVEGFGGFLVAPDLQQLVKLGYPDPVVYVVCGEDGGWAVLMKPGSLPDLTSLPLPQLTRAATQEHALSSWFSFASEPDYGAAVKKLDAIAGWCWEACMERICASLDVGSRATIIPIGPVGMLPLHVAFTPRNDARCGRHYALDHLVISYAPNLRIAAFSRRPPGPPDAPRVTAFAPNPAAASDSIGDQWALPFSGPEARYVSGLYASPSALLGTDAAPGVLVDSLRQPGFVHFAGHARVSPSVSNANFLRFGDSKLLLDDLRAVQDAEAELVVLSACTSTLPAVSHPEQALTIGNVLLVSGVRGVVATMWRVIDDATALLACRFQELLRESPTRVPEALRSAQQWLRDASPATLDDAARAIGIELETEPEWWSSPIAWGAFVHCGSAGSRGLAEPRRLPRPRASGFDPRDIADYYSFPTGYDGAGVSVAVVDVFGDYKDSDLESYFAATGRPRPLVERIQIDKSSESMAHADPGSSAGLTGFLQVVGSMAPGARIAVYLAENNEMGLLNGLSRAVEDEHPSNSIICWTAGAAEGDVSQGVAVAMARVYETAALMGKTVCAPAVSVVADEDGDRIGADFLGSHPDVLSCAATRGAAYLGDLLEHPGPRVESGSQIYPAPQWQTTQVGGFAAGKPGRLVPDVACLADDHGYRCLVNGQWTRIEGDAFAVALWAGLLARLNQALGRPWGIVRDLYEILGPAGALVGLPRAPAAGPPAWQPDCGWGVPDGDRILATLRRVAFPSGATA